MRPDAARNIYTADIEGRAFTIHANNPKQAASIAASLFPNSTISSTRFVAKNDNHTYRSSPQRGE